VPFNEFQCDARENSGFLSRSEFPDALLSDRGAHFETNEYRGYLGTLGIKNLRTTGYHL
jgi:hypothetical protein